MNWVEEKIKIWGSFANKTTSDECSTEGFSSFSIEFLKISSLRKYILKNSAYILKIFLKSLKIPENLLVSLNNPWVFPRIQKSSLELPRTYRTFSKSLWILSYSEEYWSRVSISNLMEYLGTSHELICACERNISIPEDELIMRRMPVLRSTSSRDFSRVSGNLLNVGDGFPNTSLVLVEHGYNLIVPAKIHQYLP